MKTIAIVCFVLSACTHAQAETHRYGGCPHGYEWIGDLFNEPCTAAQIAKQAEFDAQDKAQKKQEADREAQAKQDKLDADFHAIELSCRASSITYFQCHWLR